MTYLITFIWRVLTVFDFMVITALAWLLALIPKHGLGKYYVGLFRIWCRSFTQMLGIKIRVHQHYSADLPQQYILIANHPSAFEDIGVPAVFPVTSLAKAEVQQWPILGRISTAAGTLYVKREEKESRQAALTSMVDFLATGQNLALYPEGGCKGRRLYERFLRGAFAASVTTGVPILPVFIHYEAQESFEWAGQTLPQKILELATSPNKQVNFHVFEPLKPEGYLNEEAMRDAAYALYQEWDARFLC